MSNATGEHHVKIKRVWLKQVCVAGLAFWLVAGRLLILAGLALSLASHAVADAGPARQFILVNREPGPVSREGFEVIRHALPDVAGGNVRVGIGYIFSYVCIYNWEGIRDNAPVLYAIRQTVTASAAEGRVTK